MTTPAAFSRPALEAQALALAPGLSNFGHPQYQEPLERLCAALEAEAKLSDFGRGLLQHKLVELLVNRLRMEDWFARHPEIADEQIAAPWVIVGLPRTGTTLLQRLLAQDPAHYAMHWWETRYPVPFPDEPLAAPAQRQTQARAEVAVMVEAMPKLMAIHPMNADEADEELMLMEHSFRAAFNAYAHVPSYMDWLHGSDEGPAYQELRRCLQFLQWQKRQRGIVAQHWLLKAPHHLLRMRYLLQHFPGARVIQTHRDPVDTIPSIASFIHTLHGIYGQAPQPLAIGAEWAGLMARAFAATAAERAKNPAQFTDVRFEETVREPMALVQRLYAEAGRTLSTEAEAAMRRWLAANGREKREAHDYSPEDYGLSREGLAAQFADYRHQHHIA